MTTTHHDPAEEEIMAYLDGELDAAAADRVARHLEECAACAGVAAAFRETSRKLTAWQVGPAPAFASRVRDIRSGRVWSRVPARYAAVAALAIMALGAGWMWRSPMAMQAPESTAAPIALGGAEYRVGTGAEMTPPRAVTEVTALKSTVSPRAVVQVPETGVGPLLVRTGRLMLSATDFESARRRFEAIVAEAGGFMGQVVVSGGPRDRRSLSATVRVPSAQFEKTLGALRTIGVVTSESQNGEDVTQQSVDLDARLSNARASEARLKTILEQRTGRLSDVLDVEREISRVRGEVERMEAERKSLDGRIQFAAIDVTILEEQKASLDLGPLPLSTRFRNAFVEGWRDALGGVVEAGLVVTGLLPTVFVLTLVVLPAVIFYRRRMRA
jgi:hypothetical protein